MNALILDYVIEVSRACGTYPEEWVVWTAYRSEIMPECQSLCSHVSIVAMCPTKEAAETALRLLRMPCDATEEGPAGPIPCVQAYGHAHPKHVSAGGYQW